MIDKLSQSRLTQLVASLSETYEPASATADQSTGQPTTVVDATTRWEPSPDGFHTSAHASYRLGGLGGAGSSALVQVLCPQVAGSDEIVLLLDMGLSYIDGVKATLLADLLHASLMVLGTDLLPVVAQLAPASTPMAQVEVHWGSPDVIDSVARPIPAACQIDLSVFGNPTSARRSDASYSEYPPAGPLTPDSSKEIVLRALESVTLDSGYLDPDPGLVVIHTHLYQDA